MTTNKKYITKNPKPIFTDRQNVKIFFSITVILTLNRACRQGKTLYFMFHFKLQFYKN